MDKVFQIFKSGKHTAMNGIVFNVSDVELNFMAAYYPPTGGRLAPLTLGHPANDSPVMGYVQRLFFKNGGLFAHADVSDSLVDKVRRGYFKHVSASFFLTDHPQNPRPGAYSLKHVGFLGSVPPAVRGMEPLAFSETGWGVVYDSERRATVEFMEEHPAPAGYAKPYSMGLYGLAKEYQRVCPSLSFAEAEQLASWKFNLN